MNFHYKLSSLFTLFLGYDIIEISVIIIKKTNEGDLKIVKFCSDFFDGFTWLHARRAKPIAILVLLLLPQPHQ
jgi:hypothetical protein